MNMSDKISPVSVIKEAFGLIKTAPKAFIVYVAVGWGVIFCILFITFRYELDWTSINPFLTRGMQLLLGSLLLVVVSNHYVMLQRDVVTLLPRRFVGKWIKTFMIMLSFSMAMYYVNNVLEGFVGEVSAILFQGQLPVLASFVVVVLASCVLLRWSFWLPSIAVGDDIDIVIAAQMAKGHTFRVLIPFLIGLLLVSVPMTVLNIVVSFVPFGQAAAPGLISCKMLLLVMYAVVAVAVFSVWYEKFRLRNESLMAEAPTE